MQSGKEWRCDSTKRGLPNSLGRTLVSSANGIHKMIFYVTSSCRSLATENDLQQFHVKCQFTCCQTLYKWYFFKRMIQQSENVYKIHPMQHASCFTVAFLLNSNVHDRTRTWNHAEQIFGVSDSMRFMKIFHTVSIACESMMFWK